MQIYGKEFLIQNPLTIFNKLECCTSKNHNMFNMPVEHVEFRPSKRLEPV